MIATLQNIIVNEYVPALLGGSLPSYRGYVSSIDPSISVEFQAAAFRVGHSFIPSGFFLRYRSDTCDPKSFKTVPLCADSSFHRGTNTSIEDLIRGLASQRMERSDPFFSDAVQNHLVAGMNQPISQSDLAALNIMRGRDVGLADYKTVRAAYHLEPRSSFENISDALSISEPDLFDRLKKLYRNQSNLDLYVGGLLEIDESTSVVGETFAAIIVEQFMRLRDGDRFWFENTANGLFNASEVAEIKRVTLYNVIVETTDLRDDEIQANVFYDTDAPCRQPYQLNATGLDIAGVCGPPTPRDFFAGNEGCFISSICALFAIPLGKCWDGSSDLATSHDALHIFSLLLCRSHSGSLQESDDKEPATQRQHADIHQADNQYSCCRCFRR